MRIFVRERAAGEVLWPGQPYLLSPTTNPPPPPPPPLPLTSPPFPSTLPSPCSCFFTFSFLILNFFSLPLTFSSLLLVALDLLQHLLTHLWPSNILKALFKSEPKSHFYFLFPPIFLAWNTKPLRSINIPQQAINIDFSALFPQYKHFWEIIFHIVVQYNQNQKKYLKISTIKIPVVCAVSPWEAGVAIFMLYNQSSYLYL